jgi:hypothetical protein
MEIVLGNRQRQRQRQCQRRRRRRRRRRAEHAHLQPSNTAATHTALHKVRREQQIRTPENPDKQKEEMRQEFRVYVVERTHTTLASTACLFLPHMIVEQSLGEPNPCSMQISGRVDRLLAHFLLLLLYLHLLVPPVDSPWTRSWQARGPDQRRNPKDTMPAWGRCMATQAQTVTVQAEVRAAPAGTGPRGHPLCPPNGDCPIVARTRTESLETTHGGFWVWWPRVQKHRTVARHVQRRRMVARTETQTRFPQHGTCRPRQVKRMLTESRRPWQEWPAGFVRSALLVCVCVLWRGAAHE